MMAALTTGSIACTLAIGRYARLDVFRPVGRGLN
jgi:hypothetical protein